MRRVSNNINDLLNHGGELRTVDVFVTGVRRVVTAGEIDGSNPKFRSNEGNIGKGTLRGLEAFAGNVLL